MSFLGPAVERRELREVLTEDGSCVVGEFVDLVRADDGATTGEGGVNLTEIVNLGCHSVLFPCWPERALD